MQSQSWTTIKQAYESLPLSLQPKNIDRIGGYQHMVTLLPYFQQNEIIDSCIRFLSHYSLVLMINTKDLQVHVMPPGLIFSGSGSEFCVSLFDPKENKMIEQKRFSILLFDDVVNTTEKYLLQIQQNRI